MKSLFFVIFSLISFPLTILAQEDIFSRPYSGFKMGYLKYPAGTFVSDSSQILIVFPQDSKEEWVTLAIDDKTVIKINDQSATKDDLRKINGKQVYIEFYGEMTIKKEVYGESVIRCYGQEVNITVLEKKKEKSKGSTRT